MKRRWVLGWLSAVALCGAICVPLRAQVDLLHAQGPLPSFEVATVKEYDPKQPVTMPYPNREQATARRVGTLRPLIAEAYQVSDAKARVLGGPDWLDKTVYQIDGKFSAKEFAAMQTMTAEGRNREQSLMLQQLLADRFKLRMHVERREMPGYDLVVAKGGAKVPETGAKPEADAASYMSIDPKTGTLTVKNMPLVQIFRMPGMMLDRKIVVNKTGLDGTYSFDLNLGPITLSGTPGSGQEKLETGVSPFTAVQEQLGLKLVPSKVQAEVIVIDHVEMPSEN